MVSTLTMYIRLPMRLMAGRGYVLPDGQIQPGYQMFDTRRYLLRMRAALAEQGKTGNFVLHITNHMIAPWIESADIALAPDHAIYPYIKAKTSMDFSWFWNGFDSTSPRSVDIGCFPGGVSGQLGYDST